MSQHEKTPDAATRAARSRSRPTRAKRKRMRASSASTHQEHQLWRERLTIVSVTIGVALLLGFSLVVVALPSSSPEAKDLAQQILPSITTGLLGYFVGRRGSSG